MVNSMDDPNYDVDYQFPGLAIGRALKTWKDPLVYQKYLRKFARDYADIVAQMSALETIASSALAHKVKGAAGSLAIERVSVLAGEVDEVLRAGENTADSFSHLQSALEIALKSIEQYASPNAQLVDAVSVSFDRKQVAVSLEQMLVACDSDRPLEVRPVLAALDKILPPSALLALHATFMDFDLRGTEAATLALASALGIAKGGC